MLDVMLSGMDGFEILRRIKSDPKTKTIPVILLSNLGQESDIQKIKNFGVVDYFVKAQTSVEDLVTIFKNIIERQNAHIQA